MNLAEPFYENIRPFLEVYGSQVTNAGIRYGSVAYLTFGPSKFKSLTPKITAMVYAIEIEIGADNWTLCSGGTEILNSGFSDIEAARTLIERSLVGRRVRGIEVQAKQSAINFGNQLVLRSQIGSEPASGFLYSLHVEGGSAWETLDGITRSGLR